MRRSSSYFEHIEALNDARWAQGKPPLRLRAADERLEDFDLLQMVDAGLIPAIVVDSHKADFWAQVFDNIRVHDDIAVNEGRVDRLGDAQGKPEADGGGERVLAQEPPGTLMGNLLLERYLGEAGDMGGEAWTMR